MNRNLRSTLVAAAAVVAATAGCSVEQNMRQRLLRTTPLGSTMEQVEQFCASNKLRCKRSDNAGFLNQHTGKVVGERSMWGVLEEDASMPLMTTVISAYWGFDRDGRLVDIWVWKTTDAP